jgi:hypothetical protein
MYVELLELESWDYHLIHTPAGFDLTTVGFQNETIPLDNTGRAPRVVACPYH